MVEVLLFSFLGSFYSCLFNMDQVYLTDFVIAFMVSILIFVVGLMVLVFFNKSSIKFFGFNSKILEFWCGIVPIIILLVQAVFSYNLLFWDSLVFNNVELESLGLNVKVVGHQWFWSYEYGGIGAWMKFDSYMLGGDFLDLGGLRLLEVDNRLVLPVSTYVCLNVNSVDVIHSWYLPSYGFKLDALPGVNNVRLLWFDSVGVYYGMCSEICGAGHSYMPVVVEVVPLDVFYSWVEDCKHEYDIVTRLGDWYKLHGVSSFV